jgi:hypothetical protein
MLVPSAVRTAIATTDTSARISAYSTSAWPSSRFSAERTYAMRISNIWISPPPDMV